MKIILPIVIGLVVAFFYWNRRPVSRTPKEVAELLEARLRGDEAPGAWDYFTSCRIGDERLEAIRLSVEEIEVLGSKYLEGSTDKPTMALNELGISRFQELLSECKQLNDSSSL